MYATATTAGEFFRTLEESGLTLTQCKVLTALTPGAQGEPQAAKDIAVQKFNQNNPVGLVCELVGPFSP